MKGKGDKNRLHREEPRGSIPGLRVRSVAQLKYIYTSAHNMGNRQEYLEAIVQQENYDFVGSWCGRKLAWLKRELSLRPQEKKKVYHLWKKGQATCEEYKDVARICSKKIRMEKPQIELNLGFNLPQYKICMKVLKSIQRNATKMVKVLEGKTFEEWLKSLVCSTREEKAEVRPHHDLQLLRRGRKTLTSSL